jgi:hypothetical protein
MAQFKSHQDDLMNMQRAHSLNRNTLMAEVADNSAVGFVKADVSQGAQIVPVVGSGLPRRGGCCLHIRRRESLVGQGLYLETVSPA